jgi:hypothetical protein
MLLSAHSIFPACGCQPVQSYDPPRHVASACELLVRGNAIVADPLLGSVPVVVKVKEVFLFTCLMTTRGRERNVGFNDSNYRRQLSHRCVRPNQLTKRSLPMPSARCQESFDRRSISCNGRDIVRVDLYEDSRRLRRRLGKYLWHRGMFCRDANCRR